MVCYYVKKLYLSIIYKQVNIATVGGIVKCLIPINFFEQYNRKILKTIPIK